MKSINICKKLTFIQNDKLFGSAASFSFVRAFSNPYPHYSMILRINTSQFGAVFLEDFCLSNDGQREMVIYLRLPIYLLRLKPNIIQQNFHETKEM